MRKVGFLWIGHADYICEITDAIQQEALSCVKDLPHFDGQISSIAVTDSEAVSAARKLVEEDDCCGAVIVLASWVECNVVMSAVKELRGRPCMFWGFPVDRGGGETVGSGAYVSASMISGVVRRLGLRCPVLIAGTKTGEARQKLAAFSAAAAAMDALNYAKIGLFGYTSMSIYTGTFDHMLMRYKIGPEIEQMDTYSLLRAAEAIPHEQIDEAIEKLQGCACIKPDVKADVLWRTMAIYLALKNFCEEKQWAAVNVKCQYELSKEYCTVPCVALSLLAGDGVTASCEGDILNTVSMLLLQYLCGDTVWYGDSLTHWGSTVQFSPCGFMPFSMACGTANVRTFDEPGFAGLHVQGVLRPEKITFLRLVEDIGSYHLIYGTGTGMESSPRAGKYPALDVVLDGSIDDFCREYAGQHYAVAYGDLSAELEQYAALTGIEARRI